MDFEITNADIDSISFTLNPSIQSQTRLLQKYN